MHHILNMKTLLIALTTLVSLGAQSQNAMTHIIKPLPYKINALEPHMSQQTLEYHWGKHLQTYINNLNNLIKGTEFENSSLQDVVMRAEGGIFNNGAQAYNHELFFDQFSPVAKLAPSGALMAAIDEQFGGLASFKEQFTKSALSLFGAGWTWLAADKDGKLLIVNESNAGNPLRKGLKPLFGADVWEHSYYLDYQNRRADYLTAFWNILDWRVVEKRFGK